MLKFGYIFRILVLLFGSIIPFLKLLIKGVGTPLKLDLGAKERIVRLYASILVEVDFCQPNLSNLKVTRSNGKHVVINVDYETEPVVCANYGIVGHSNDKCKSTATAAFAEPSQADRGRALASSTTRRHKVFVSRPCSRRCVTKAFPLLNAEVEVGSPTIIRENSDNNSQPENYVLPLVNHQTSEQSSSFDSVPPGFQKPVLEVEMPASSTE